MDLSTSIKAQPIFSILQTKIKIRSSGTKTHPRKQEARRRRRMGYVLRVRLASFFVGVATASAAGLYFLHKDYKIAHEAISHQVKSMQESFDGRLSAVEKLKERVSELEKLKETEAPQQVEAAE